MATKIISGIFIMSLSLWGGCYLMFSAYPHPHWASFPSFTTAFLGFCGGVCLVVWAFIEKEKKENTDG